MSNFGWASARLDDLVNLPASRLVGAADHGGRLFTPGASASDAFGAVLRDAAATARPMPAIRKRLLPARSVSRSQVRVIMAASWSRMCGWEMDATPPRLTIIRAALTLYRRADMVLIGVVALLATLIAVAI